MVNNRPLFPVRRYFFPGFITPDSQQKFLVLRPSCCICNLTNPPSPFGRGMINNRIDIPNTCLWHGPEPQTTADAHESQPPPPSSSPRRSVSNPRAATARIPAGRPKTPARSADTRPPSAHPTSVKQASHHAVPATCPDRRPWTASPRQPDVPGMAPPGDIPSEPMPLSTDT